jgi:hypothetical protein
VVGVERARALRHGLRLQRRAPVHHRNAAPGTPVLCPLERAGIDPGDAALLAPVRAVRYDFKTDAVLGRPPGVQVRRPGPATRSAEKGRRVTWGSDTAGRAPAAKARRHF